MDNGRLASGSPVALKDFYQSADLQEEADRLRAHPSLPPAAPKGPRPAVPGGPRCDSPFPSPARQLGVLFLHATKQPLLSAGGTSRRREAQFP